MSSLAHNPTATAKVPIPLQLTVNGLQRQLRIDGRSALLEVIRDGLGLYGAKRGCNQGACGACTVLLDGERVLSCLTLAVQCEGREVTTIEGIDSSDDLSSLQQAFIEHDGFQCGYCTPGQICSAIGMLGEAKRGVPSVVSNLASSEVTLTKEEIRERLSGNLCRCGAYNGIVEAVSEIAQEQST